MSGLRFSFGAYMAVVQYDIKPFVAVADDNSLCNATRSYEIMARCEAAELIIPCQIRPHTPDRFSGLIIKEHDRLGDSRFRYRHTHKACNTVAGFRAI